MKTIQSIKKSKQIDKDFAVVCKKHKLERVAIAIEFPVDKKQYTVMSSCHIRGKKGRPEEKHFAIEMGYLFQFIGFNPQNIEMATSILKANADRYKPSKKEMALSKADRFWLDAIRRKKFDLIKKKRYEEASLLRMEERKLLGIHEEAEPKSSHESGKAFDMEDFTAKTIDIIKAGQIIFDAIKKDQKNWKIKK